MERARATDIIVSVLAGIAPEIDPGTVDPAGELQFEFDLDSMDFLNLVEGLKEETGVDVPESDYPRVRSLDGITGYLAARA
jgi:acyl carrier protein